MEVFSILQRVYFLHPQRTFQLFNFKEEYLDEKIAGSIKIDI